MALGQREIPDTATPEARAWAERAFEIRDKGEEGQQEVFEVRCCDEIILWNGSWATCKKCGWAINTGDLIRAHGLESLGRFPVGTSRRIAV